VDVSVNNVSVSPSFTRLSDAGLYQINLEVPGARFWHLARRVVPAKFRFRKLHRRPAFDGNAVPQNGFAGVRCFRGTASAAK